MKRATAFAPASIGNVAVGFDVLGHSVAGPGDTVTVSLNSTGEVRITSIKGVVTSLPANAADNTAGRALLHLKRSCDPSLGFDVEIEKGIALGSGMGGSAASAVAAVVAANALLDAPLGLEALYQSAMDGEAAASGSAHGDNVGPMLLGGLVIAPTSGAAVKVPVPHWLHVALVHPHFVLETKTARAVLQGPWQLHDFVVQSEGLALFLAGCFQSDASLLRRGLRDVLVEPRRASLIPGFAAVKQAALDAGAIGASIAGAGPSVFAWFESPEQAEAASVAMAAQFEKAGLKADRLVSPVNGPAARVIS
ncbi:MAG: homoserine kinase [Myxococcaceae bacterium]